MTAAASVHGRASARHQPIIRTGTVPVDRSLLFAGHAECPSCGSFVRRITQLGERSIVGELVEGWCSVCSTSTFFLLGA